VARDAHALTCARTWAAFAPYPSGYAWRWSESLRNDIWTREPAWSLVVVALLLLDPLRDLCRDIRQDSQADRPGCREVNG
jgi:hypothetical protein